jgi:hypothetical protein
MSNFTKGIFSAAMLRDMVRQFKQDPPDYNLDAHTFGNRQHSFSGIDIMESPHFPYVTACSTCAGTGEGADSTYCDKCKGGGRVKYLGFMTNQQDISYDWRGAQPMSAVLIVEYFPKRFQPSFPKGLVPPANPVKGLHYHV